MRKRVFSAVQPTGILHIGNYAGSIRNWLSLQQKNTCIFSIVDLHALTVSQKREDMRRNILSTVAMYLACGIDPKEHILFIQSQVQEHAVLQWILSTQTKLSELKLMHQFKEKSSKAAAENINAGLFMYPVLMAADILLYKTELVPVGEDQKQHLELTRELARRFNSVYGATFVVPEGYIPSLGARIMGLDDPKKKMSKTASSSLNYIALTDRPDVIKKKIMRAVTDSGSEIVSKSSKPAIANLMEIYSVFSGKEIKDIEAMYKGKGYGDFKRELIDVLITFLTPLQKRYENYLSNERYLIDVLRDGALRAEKIAKVTLAEVEEKVGIAL